jgi:predicted permease
VTWWRRLFARRELERQLDVELRDHIERLVTDYRAAGMSEPHARRRARLEFGGLDQVKEMCRDARGTEWLDRARQDLTYAWRGLGANRIFALAIVVSLTLGIGANTAVYTLIKAALIRSLPVPEPHRLVHLVAFDATGDQSSHFSYRLYRELADALGADAETFATNGQNWERLSLGGGAAERIVTEAVSSNYFHALRVGAAEGRVLIAADDNMAGGSRVAVLSFSFWERRFGSNRSIIGTALDLDGVSYTIVGVAVRGFDGVETQSATEVWIPVTAKLPTAWLSMTGSMVLSVMARTSPAAAVGQLSAVADVAYRRHLLDHFIPRLPEDVKPQFAARHMRARPAAAGLSSAGREYRRPLVVLMVSAAIVLLLCCANVANLLLSRQCARAREFALRVSLGATQGRLVQQFLTESLVLAALGAVGGLFVGWWGAETIADLLPDGRIPVKFNLSPDRQALAFTACVSVLASIAVGLLPALRAGRTPATSLVQNARTVLRPRASKGLVILQVAGSLVLLVMAGLMARTVHNLSALDLGFRPENVFAFELSFPKNLASERRAVLYSRLDSRLQNLPGVSGMTYSQESVYSNGGWSGEAVGDVAEAVPVSQRSVALLRVGPRFFDVLGLRRADGRVFAPTDHRAGTRTIVVNETLARHFFGRQSAVGQSIELDAAGVARYLIVGVVEDAWHYGARGQPCGGRVVYFPIDVNHAVGSIFVRGTLPHADLARIVGEEVGATQGDVLVERVRRLQTDVDAMVSRERLVGFLAALFAVLAVGLAAVGLYGVLAYGVSQRIPEMGLRAALGANPAALVQLVLTDAWRLVGTGLVLGATAAVYGGRLLTNLLFGVEPIDPLTMTGAVMMLAAVATCAAYVPARRAASVEPTVALRE